MAYVPLSWNLGTALPILILFCILETRMEKQGLSTEGPHSVDGTPHPSGADDMDVDRPGDGKDASGAANGPQPPSRRFKLSERMKGLIWNLVCLSNECCRIENEKK